MPGPGLLHISPTPKKSLSAHLLRLQPSPSGFTSPQKHRGHHPHGHSVNKAEQRGGQELQGEGQGGRKE